MNSRTRDVLMLAWTADRRGFVVDGLRVTTPDGRGWLIETAAVGLRLFELSTAGGEPEEHTAVEDDTWDAGDLMDYLAAVGTRR